jgi:hypothetical protein
MIAQSAIFFRQAAKKLNSEANKSRYKPGQLRFETRLIPHVGRFFPF